MTNEEIEKILDDMGTLFPKLPNPEREPRQFKYFVKLFRHIEGLHNEKSETSSGK